MNATQGTLEMVRAILSNAGTPNELAKFTFSQPSGPTTGLQNYDLEAPAKNLVPYLSPLRNRIPRVSGKGGIQANWRAVTGVNTNQVNAGVSEGRRGGQIAIATKDYFAAYRTIGLEDSVSFEAELSAEGFDDLRSRAVTSLLQGTMVEEEKIILGGNATHALGQTPTPSLSAGTTGGTIGTGITVSVICVGLSFDAYRRFTVAGGLFQQISRTNADGTTDIINGGTAIPSANATVSTASSTATVTAKVSPVQGMYAYAWYAGTVGGERLAAITTVAQAVITALPGTGQLASQLAAADYSADTLIFDGLLGMCGNSNFGSYWNALSTGASFTPDGAGGINEIDTALQYFWDTYRLVPDSMLISSQEARSFKKVITQQGTATSLARFTFQQVQGQLVAGGNARGYLTTFGDQREIPFEQHPYMPPGTIMFLTEKLPYPMNNVNNVMQIRYRRDYWQNEWPLRTRAYEFGVYSDQVLQHYFPPSMGVITNITPN